MGNNKREKGCSFKLLVRKCFTKKVTFEDFPGSPVVKNPPANAGDTDLIPGWELRSHVPWNNRARAPQLLAGAHVCMPQREIP